MRPSQYCFVGFQFGWRLTWQTIATGGEMALRPLRTCDVLRDDADAHADAGRRTHAGGGAGLLLLIRL